MTLHHPVDPVARARPRRASRCRLFAVTLFASALLLFAVQPMFTKMVLPSLGGAPSVWSVAMVFFQAALLVGYAYAHLLARTLAGRARRRWCISPCWRPRRSRCRSRSRRVRRRRPRAESGSGWSGCSRPRSGCRSSRCRRARRCCRAGSRRAATAQARNPYVLYAASNLGSFAALLAYPLVIESLLPLRATGLGLVGRLCGARAAGRDCGDVSRRAAPDALEARGRRRTRPTARDVSAGSMLAAIPAGLDHRGDGLHLDRRRRRAVPLGAAARALSADLRGGVPRPAVVSARSRRQAGAVSGRRRSRSRCSAATANTGSPASRSTCSRCSLLALRLPRRALSRGARRPRGSPNSICGPRSAACSAGSSPACSRRMCSTAPTSIRS